MSFQPTQKSISYDRTRSSRRLAQNSQIPSPSKDIDDTSRPSKKTKTRNSSSQFDIYEDVDIELNDRNTRESSIISISPKQPRIPRITVEIPRRQPFQEIDPNIARPNDHFSTIARLPDRIVSLSSLRKWQKAQPNDHTSKILRYLRYLRYLLTIYIDPWPPDESTAEASIDQLLLGSNYDPSTLEGKTVREILRKIPKYYPIPILNRLGKPRNIDISKSWSPLSLFLLFWTPELLKLVCKETNSYGFRESTVKTPWKSLTPLEFLYFIGTYLLSGL